MSKYTCVVAKRTAFQATVFARRRRTRQSSGGLERSGHKAATKLPSVLKRWICGTYTRPYDARPDRKYVRDMASRSVPLGTRVRGFLREALLVELRDVTAWWRQEAGVTAGEEGQRAIESESSEKESAIERYSFLARTYTDGNSATAKLKLIARFHSTPVRISKHNVTKHNG